MNKCIAHFANARPCKILLAHLIFWGEDVEIRNHKFFLEPIPLTPFFCLINGEYNSKKRVVGVAGFS